MSGPEQAVIVSFACASRDLRPLHELEDELVAAIDSAGAGEYDGNEIALDGADGHLYMYGPDADALFAVVRPILERSDLTRGARVELRYGPPADGVREEHVVLDG